MVRKLLFAAIALLAFSQQSNAQCTAQVTGNNFVCYGDTAQLMGTPGGTTYQWNSYGVPIPGATNMYYVASYSDELSVTIDFSGCIATSAPFTFTEGSIFYMNLLNTTTLTCAGGSLSADCMPAGGTPPYTYSWNGPNSFMSTSQNLFIANTTVADAGLYYITVTDANGCTAMDSILMSVTALPVAPGTVDEYLCQYQSAQPLTATGQNLLWYTVQVGGTGMSTVIPNTTVPGTVTYWVSQTVNGCEGPRSPLNCIVSTCDSVWPGDVNYDLVADNNDVLDLALAYGSTGAVRTGASNNWVAQYCASWNTNQTSGIDMKHADCNGDGTVDANDTTAISLNYGQTHLKGIHIPQAKSTADPDLYFDLTGINFTPNTTVSIPIKLGTSALPMSNILGIAADIVVSGISLDNAPSVSAATSWIGNNSNTMNFTKGVGTNQTDWTLARTDHNNVSGDGTIATLAMDIPSGTEGQDVVLYFTNVRIIDNNGAEITNFNVVDDTATVALSVNTTANSVKYLAVAPNPSGEQASLHLSLAEAANLKVVISDVTGRQVSSFSVNATKGAQTVALPASQVAPGLYNIHITGGEGKVNRNLKWMRN